MVNVDHAQTLIVLRLQNYISQYSYPHANPHVTFDNLCIFQFQRDFVADSLVLQATFESGPNNSAWVVQEQRAAADVG